MNVCFLMYPWESIKSPENDTSLTLIHECMKRNHGVAICTPSNLTIRNSVTSAFCTILNRTEKVSGNIKSFYKNTTTREEMLPIAGFDVIFIETVGVGQSETMVHDMVDYFLLLMLSGAGDELQGMKRGIMELADTLLITKADSGNEKKSEMARREYANAVHLFPEKESQWVTNVITTSSVNGNGLQESWDNIVSYFNQITLNGFYDSNRMNQNSRFLKTV